MSRFLVTGATGNTGQPAVATLLARGASVRAAVRDPVRAQRLRRAGAELVAFDYARPETFPRALEGVTGMFLVRPPIMPDAWPTLDVLVREARQAGVEHVVVLSIPSAEQHWPLPHRRAEERVIRSGLAWTFLRAGFFAQTLGGPCIDDIRADHALRMPRDEGRVAWVDSRDVGEAAAVALLEPASRGEAWELTGPEALHYTDIARILSEALGYEVHYEPASLARHARHLRSRGLPWPAVGLHTALHAMLRLGSWGGVSPTLERVLGRRPRTVSDYVREHAYLWR